MEEEMEYEDGLLLS